MDGNSVSKGTEKTYTVTGIDGEKEHSVDVYGAITVSDTGDTVNVPKLNKVISGQVTEANYGEYVDLGTNWVNKTISLEDNETDKDDEVIKTDWRIFYKDPTTNKVYLMMSDYLPNSANSTIGAGLATSGTYNWYSSSSRTDLINRLNGTSNSNAWKNLLKDTTYMSNNGIEVKGAIDLPTYVASWNEKYPSNKLYTKTDSTGYYVGTSNPPSSYSINMSSTPGYNNNLYYPHKNNTNAYGYWLASPSAYSTNHVVNVIYYGYVDYDYYNHTDRGVRPVVILPSDIIGEYNSETGVWSIQ